MNYAIDPDSLTGLEIAVIAMEGRFPGAKNVAEFWQNLEGGVESISHFGEAELAECGIEPTLLKNPNYVKARGVLENAEWFDASFFGFSPRDAEILDPQHRVFLECAWSALETAGYDPNNYDGAIGLFGGATLSGYLFNLYSNTQLVNTVGQFPIALANGRDFLTTRISYKLNLKGPSFNVQSACSTSLVAVHLASQSLLSGECDLAMAGGVSIRLPLKGGYLYSEGGIRSPDGHCRAFDANAQGTVSGSGVGIVVLKRLEDALNDRDTIDAIIKGSALNNDGTVKVSYSAPSIEGQAKAIASAQIMAEVEPENITYIEAHGTGTPLGDPIEIAALTQVFGAKTQKKFCALGAVKTNIGHLDAAAGVAGLIKTILALKHKLIPPSLNFDRPNPHIDFENSPFYVNTKASDWSQNNNTPRCAGVSSFGMGGTNAHIILEEAPPLQPRVAMAQGRYSLLLLSAKTTTALDTATQNLTNYLKQHPEENLANIAYTLQVGRRAFNYRRILVCQNCLDAVAGFEDSSRVTTGFCDRDKREIVFMFPGQGTQYPDMGKELYQTEPVFSHWIDRCAELLKPLLNLDLRDCLYPEENIRSTQINQTAIAQPAIFTVEYALTQLWLSWGIRPAVLVGHSIGEYVAACISGVFSLEDALKLVVTRSQLMQQQPPGAMLSVFLPTEQVIPLLNNNLSLAADNAPSLSVVSGTIDAIANLETILTEKGISYRRLKTSHAFHSAMMDSILEEFIAEVAKVNLSPPQIPFISNLTGKNITTEQATNPNYWAQHLRNTVKFTDGIKELLKQEGRIFLEVGAGNTLSTFTKQQNKNTPVFTSLKHPKETRSDLAFILDTVGKLWLAGVVIDWTKLYCDCELLQRVPLPTYPFERQRFWIEPQTSVTTAKIINRSKKSDISDWFYLPSWKQSPLIISADSIDQSTWLLFIDESNIGIKIAESLQASQEVIIVKIGDKFTQNNNIYTVNPKYESDYDDLIKSLQKSKLIPDRIIHFWSIELKGDRTSNCYSLLYLTQALDRQQINNSISLTVVSDRIYEVTGAEVLKPESATILGLTKVIPQEYRHINCRNIDLDLSQNNPQLIDSLFTELTIQTQDIAVAYRHKQRWIQNFEPISIPNNSTNLRQSGVYLITGGLGNIGLLLASFLAKTVKAKLILTSRLGLPERSQWSEILVNNHEPTAKKIKQIKQLETDGAEVLVLKADISDYKAMNNAIAKAQKRFGNINGVIHAAGIVGEQAFRSIQETGKAEFELQFKSKIKGTLVLEELLKEQQLDFCILCSSIATVLGGLGFAAYSAANQYLDVFARQQNKTSSFPWISINWDAWISINWDAWNFKESNSDFGSSVTELAITPSEGTAVWQRMFSLNNVSQIIVSTSELQNRIAQWVEFKNQKEDITSYHYRPKLSENYQPPRNKTEQEIADIWQQFLGIDQVGINDNFFELGGHSLLATQMVTQIRQELQLELPLRHLFENPTVASLTKKILASKNTATVAPPITSIPRIEKITNTKSLSEAEVEQILNDLLITQEILENAT